MQKTRSQWVIVEGPPDWVTIRDIGTTHMSVTNDAEAVVACLHKQGVLGNKRLFYYDSEGSLDEMLHDNKGNFTRFRFGG